MYRFTRAYKYIFIIAVSVIAVSCGTTKTVTKSPVVLATDTLSEDRLLDYKYAFFEANKYYLNGKIDYAVSLYNQCLTINPTSSATHYQLAGIYMKANELEPAVHHIDKAIEYNDENIWYKYLAANIYGKANLKDKAISTLNILIKDNPKMMDYYLALADVHLNNEEYKEAIAIYDRIDEKFGKSELISLQKSKLYMQLKDKDKAVGELYNLYNSLGQDVEIKRLIAEFFIQVKDVDEAIKVYNEILVEYPGDGFSLIGLAECYRLKNDIDKSVEYIRQAFADPKVGSDLRVSLIYNLLQMEKDTDNYYNNVKDLIKISYDEYPDNLDLKTLYADYLITVDSVPEALELLHDIVSIRKDKLMLWKQIIYLESDQNNWDTCYDLSVEALKYYPNQNSLYYFKGYSAYNLEDYESSFEALEFGLKITTSDDPIRMSFISLLAETSYQLDDKESAYKYYELYLEKESDNLMILNNYAYYLSLDKANLENAKEMSFKTIEAEPNNSTYLDTYAWVLFQMEDYNEALIYIKKAIEYNEEDNDVLFEHYGDILYFINDIEGAVKKWQKAKEIGKGSGLLDEKILQKKYIE